MRRAQEKKDSKCLDCKADLTSKQAKSIECDFCHNWYCVKCSKLKQVLFNEIAKAQDIGIMWTCGHCRVAMPGIKDLMSRMAILEKKVEKVLAQKSVSEETSRTEIVEKELIKTVLREERQEEEEISARKLNLVVHSLPENDSDNFEERKEGDTTTIKKILNEVLNLNAKISHPVRLGKKHIGSRPRPLKFTVSDFDTKRNILSATRNLKNHSQYSSVFFTPDLTKNQREAAYQLREEKRRRERAGERNLIIRRGRIVTQTRSEQGDHSYTAVTKGNARSHNAGINGQQPDRVRSPLSTRAGDSVR